jgi:hypothetical protein
MSAQELISKLRTDGYSLTISGTFLDIMPADNLSDEFVLKLKQSKPEILAALHQEQELIRLVHLIADYHEFSAEDRSEALEVALGDQQQALICFTSLARQAGLI